MVNGRDEHDDNHEEGEYHFSDEQINYDEHEPVVPQATAPASLKENLTNAVGKYRRMLIGVGVFFALIFLVYKMLTPPSQQPATEFNQAKTVPTVAPKPSKSLVPQQPVAQVAAPAPVSHNLEPFPGANQLQAGSAASMPQQPAQITPNPLATNPMTAMTQANNVMQEQMNQASAQTAAAAEAAQNKMIMDKLAALEEQNAKFMDMMQTQVAQKLTEYDRQNAATQDKMRLLGKRMGNIEASLNKMGRLLQDQGIATKMPMAVGAAGLPSARAADPKMSYTVQAIIPGRAWLKSDAGDTVTVAEGDMLRDYGRITKIDPYDGVVLIDTGAKVITLSYGSSGD